MSSFVSGLCRARYATSIVLVLAFVLRMVTTRRVSFGGVEDKPRSVMQDLPEDVVRDVEPWHGKISEISSDKLRSVMQGDLNFMLSVQRDILQLVNIKRRLPDVFRQKYKNVNDAKEEFAKNLFSVSLTLVGKAAHEGIKHAIHIYKHYKEFKNIAHELTMLQTARVKLIIDEGRTVPTEYADDVSLGALFQAYELARRAVNMKFYSKTQDWYRFKGVRPPPIYADLEHLHTRVAFMRREEEFIIDEIRSHYLPEAFASTFSSDAAGPVQFNAMSPFTGDFDGQVSGSNVTIATVTEASVAKFGHLGDGRGWVRLDVPSRYGGIQEARPFSTAQRQERCELVQQRLNQVTLPDDDTIEALRAAASKARAITHNIGWDIGELVVGAALVGVSVFFPPAAPVAGVVGTAAGLASKAVSTGSQAAFQNFLEPLLTYTLISLANLEFYMFSPDIQPQSGETICSFDPSWLDQFTADFSMPEKIPCDIVDNKCAKSQFCMREGIFTRTTGRYLRKGFCIDVPWPLLENGLTCTGDSECSSGVCDLNTILPDTTFGNGSPAVLELLRASTLDDIPENVKEMIGMCVEPCDVGDSGCVKYNMNSAFGVRRES